MDKKEKLEQLYLMQQTYATLFAVTNKLQVLGDKSFHELTSRQFMTLLAIAHIEEEASLSNVARKLGTTKQSAKQILINLEKRNYVETKQNPHDKRAVQIEITPSGLEVMHEYYKVGESVLNAWFHDFSKQELGQFYSYLRRLYHFDGEYHDGFEKEVGKRND